MGNLQKITKSVAPSILEEIERTPEEALKFNPETHYIQPELTHTNYDLTRRDMPALEYLNKRLSEIKVQNRADVKVLGQWVWTMPKDLDPQYQERFFEEIYRYNADKFGAENICYATVHLDEQTPHMHLGIIPVVKVNKARTDGKTEKLCAKDVFNREYLTHAHADLEKHLEKALGVEVNLLNGASLGIDGIRNFKAAKDLAKQVPELENTLENLQHEVWNKELQVVQLDQEIEYKKEQIVELDKTIAEKKGEVDALEGQILERRGILTKLKEKVEEVKEMVSEIKEKFTGHPNMFQMFYHWLQGGKEDKEEREEVVQDYTDYLDKYDLTIEDTNRSVDDLDKEIKHQIRRSQDRGMSL